jgi:hypothetical protein
MLIKQKAKTNDKPLAKTKSVEKASVDKSISNYFKPVEKKGSGLLINLNSI